MGIATILIKPELIDNRGITIKRLNSLTGIVSDLNALVCITNLAK